MNTRIWTVGAIAALAVLALAPIAHADAYAINIPAGSYKYFKASLSLGDSFRLNLSISDNYIDVYCVDFANFVKFQNQAGFVYFSTASGLNQTGPRIFVLAAPSEDVYYYILSNTKRTVETNLVVELSTGGTGSALEASIVPAGKYVYYKRTCNATDTFTFRLVRTDNPVDIYCVDGANFLKFKNGEAFSGYIAASGENLTGAKTLTLTVPSGGDYYYVVRNKGASDAHAEISISVGTSGGGGGSGGGGSDGSGDIGWMTVLEVLVVVSVVAVCILLVIVIRTRRK